MARSPRRRSRSPRGRSRSPRGRSRSPPRKSEPVGTSKEYETAARKVRALTRKVKSGELGVSKGGEWKVSRAYYTERNCLVGIAAEKGESKHKLPIFRPGRGEPKRIPLKGITAASHRCHDLAGVVANLPAAVKFCTLVAELQKACAEKAEK